LNGNLVAVARWSAAVLAALALAYGYGALNNRVYVLETRLADNRGLIVQLTDMSARLLSLEREVERFRNVLERSQNGATVP
jgi:hypothetical protein